MSEEYKIATLGIFSPNICPFRRSKICIQLDKFPVDIECKIDSMFPDYCPLETTETRPEFDWYQNKPIGKKTNE